MEDLANRIIGLPPTFLLSCFISGLTPKIHRQVQAHQQLTLTQAAGLAWLQEEKLLNSRAQARSRPPFSPPRPSAQPLPSMQPPLLVAPSKPSSTFPLKRLSPEELASRRECGLCFNCDEKFHRGHKCASWVFLVIADDEDEATLDASVPLDPPPDPPDINSPTSDQISLHSFSGHVAPETLRLLGHIANHQVMILVDGGSTHNFI